MFQNKLSHATSEMVFYLRSLFNSMTLTDLPLARRVFGLFMEVEKKNKTKMKLSSDQENLGEVNSHLNRECVSVCVCFFVCFFL